MNVRSVMQAFDWRTPRTVRMKVPPELSGEWLERNTHNRPWTEERTSLLARDMEEGRFRFNGDSIRFSYEGVLLDGQHRLRAAVKANFTLDTNVCFGLPPDTQETMDDPMIRSSAHQLALAGIPNASQSAAIAALILTHQRSGVARQNDMGSRPTKRQVGEFVMVDFNNGGAIQVAINQGRKLSKIGVTCGTAGFCYYLFATRSMELADRFFNELASGAELSEGNPAYLLRERLIANKATSKVKMTKIYLLALFFKAWNAYRMGTQLRNLRWHNDGPNPEPFPVVEFSGPFSREVRGAS